MEQTSTKPEVFKPTDYMRALTWKQPYASLMLSGKIETRLWNTPYRGWVLICAGQTTFKVWDVIKLSGVDQAKRIMHWEYGKEEAIKEHTGKAIGIAWLADCRPMRRDDEDACYTSYDADMFCHVYENVQPIKPFPWSGKFGWSTVKAETKKGLQFI